MSFLNNFEKKFYKNKKIFIAGHRGLIGSELYSQIKSNENCIILTKSRKELNLFDLSKIDNFLNKNKPDMIIIAAARVGGIKANYTYPADFIIDNLVIQTNLIKSALKNKIKRLSRHIQLNIRPIVEIILYNFQRHRPHHLQKYIRYRVLLTCRLNRIFHFQNTHQV